MTQDEPEHFVGDEEELLDNDVDILILEEDDLKVGLTFETEDAAVKSILKWSELTFCPLSKARYQKPKMKENGERIKGRRCFQCSHGLNYTRKVTDKRPWQKLKFTDCPVRVNINEQEDGSWMVTSLYLEHVGHPVTKADFYTHQAARKLETPDKNFVKELMKARANPKNIANVITEKKGINYSTQDVRNIITKIKASEEVVCTVEESLGSIKDEGGDVRYKKQENTDNVEVLWVQTKDMKNQLSRSAPRLFECDTTFGTQVEGYKLYIPLFYSNFTGKWEVSGLLFLTTETREKVDEGIRFFKQSLPYQTDGPGRFIFFTDKDFDYISVLESVFENCLVLLCNVHTLRYFREKVFTGKSYWGDANCHNYMSGSDKDDLMAQLILVRDAPSENLYRERESKLIDMTKNLNIRPGQSSKPISFIDYYRKNWMSCSFRWVFAFRKNLPTNGANDTQAIESTFAAIKRFSKLEFPGRTPSLKELIQVLPRALDERTAQREQDISVKRLTINVPDPVLNRAFGLASWKLNKEGMKKYHECVKMAESREQNMTLDGNVITEQYTGKNTKTYTGKYTSDGFSCNCSWFASTKMCRHPFFFRKMSNLPLFDIKCFHPSFLMIQEPDTVSNDISDSPVDCDDRLASPGMEHLIKEQMEENKKMKPNVKFNKAFDVAKVCAEYLSKYNTESFKDNLQIFQAFTELMRTGIPPAVKDAILKSSISSTGSDSDASSDDSPRIELFQQDLPPEDQARPAIKDLPEEHQVCLNFFIVCCS